jgi:hypothetical protein
VGHQVHQPAENVVPTSSICVALARTNWETGQRGLRHLLETAQSPPEWGSLPTTVSHMWSHESLAYRLGESS